MNLAIISVLTKATNDILLNKKQDLEYINVVRYFLWQAIRECKGSDFASQRENLLEQYKLLTRLTLATQSGQEKMVIKPPDLATVRNPSTIRLLATLGLMANQPPNMSIKQDTFPENQTQYNVYVSKRKTMSEKHEVAAKSIPPMKTQNTAIRSRASRMGLKIGD